MAKGVIHIQWYATVLQDEIFADAIAEQAAPLTFKYGATKYSVMRSKDDPYRMTQYVWFDSHDDWYRYWEGPEMREFRAYWSQKYQVPIVYVWFDEIASGVAATSEPTGVVAATAVIVD
jgi:hypothetical protein